MKEETRQRKMARVNSEQVCEQWMTEKIAVHGWGPILSALWRIAVKWDLPECTPEEALNYPELTSVQPGHPFFAISQALNEAMCGAYDLEDKEWNKHIAKTRNGTRSRTLPV